MDPIRLPHHRLQAYGVALELLAAVRAAAIRDASLRDQAMRSAKSACLNAAEGAGRVSKADKARVFGIARAEAGEAAAAVEIAGARTRRSVRRNDDRIDSVEQSSGGAAPISAAIGTARYRVSPRSICFRRTASESISPADSVVIAPIASAKSIAPISS
jgi:four helix bundle protein